MKYNSVLVAYAGTKEVASVVYGSSETFLEAEKLNETSATDPKVAGLVKALRRLYPNVVISTQVRLAA
jgi:hypothetical protein